MTEAPPARYDVGVLRDCAIPAPGGVRLAADVYLPRDAPPAPALVTLAPYDKDGIAGVTGWQAHRWFAARGYACVVADCRGTGASGGRPLPPFDPAEGADGAAAIAWAAAQPWCDGHVGMWGVSYGATLALRTASLRPPALGAVVPVMGFLDPERDFIHPGGRRGCLASLGLWGVTTLAQHLAPPLARDPGWERAWEDRLEGDPYLVDLLRHGPGDPVWRARAVDAGAIRAPAFCVAGWRDLSCDAMVRAYESVRGPRQLLVGPWLHTLPDESPVEPVGFLALALAWWDRWLRGAGAEEGPPVTVHLQGRGAWLRMARWPPGDAAVRLCAGADGGLAADAAPGVARRPVDPTVGARGGLWGVPARGLGVRRDQHDDDARALAFTGEPLEEPLAICGRPAVTLALVAEPPEPRTLVVRLADVAPDGVSLPITAGTAAAASAESRLELFPTAYELPAGHRLRLVVAGADFPRLWPDPAPAELVVACGGRTRLELPVLVPGDADAAQPPPAEGGGSHPLVMRADPLHTVTHDAVREALTVTVGEHLLLRTPHDAQTLDVNGHVSGTLPTADPRATRVRGRSTVRAATPHGEVVVRAEVLLAGETATLAGDVTIDGERALARRWTLP